MKGKAHQWRSNPNNISNPNGNDVELNTTDNMYQICIVNLHYNIPSKIKTNKYTISSFSL